eukprot:scpid82670/ scgid9238/ 
MLHRHSTGVDTELTAWETVERTKHAYWMCHHHCRSELAKTEDSSMMTKEELEMTWFNNQLCDMLTVVADILLTPLHGRGKGRHEHRVLHSMHISRELAAHSWHFPQDSFAHVDIHIEKHHAAANRGTVLLEALYPASENPAGAAIQYGVYIPLRLCCCYSWSSVAISATDARQLIPGV